MGLAAVVLGKSTTTTTTTTTKLQHLFWPNEPGVAQLFFVGFI
jgi:hypothetical protein